MTESNAIQDMFARDAGAGPPASDNHVETQRSIDPQVSLEDYNRTMLEYTQQQMSSFVDLDGRGSGSGGRSSESSGSSSNSGRSNGSVKGVTPSQSGGLPPTSAGAAAAKRRHLHNGGQTSALSPNEAKSSQY